MTKIVVKPSKTYVNTHDVVVDGEVRANFSFIRSRAKNTVSTTGSIVFASGKEEDLSCFSYFDDVRNHVVKLFSVDA